jgi:DNA-binding CsgD family transcriptional regulator/N-acetylneuraminic acid mutarotase
LTEPTLHDKLIFKMQNDSTITGPSELTEREKEILRLVATGTSNKEIAHQLFISANTVKVHLRNIFAKIGVVSRTEAAMHAVRMGLVQTLEPESEDLAQIKPAGNGSISSTTLSRLNTDFPAEAGSIQAASQTSAIQVPHQPSPVLRLAGMVAVILILLVAVGIGIVVARQPVGSVPGTSQVTATPESRWHALASLPTARAGLAATVYENQVYAMGGETAQGVVATVERYDPLTDSWVKLSQKPTPVTDVNAAVVGGKIYVPGGRTSSGTVINSLEIYDPREDTWEKGANLPIKMSAYALTAFEGRLYLFGGWDGNKYLNSVLIFDPAQNHWAVLTPMPEARGFAGAAVLGDKIYVIGGYDSRQTLAVNDVYTPHLEGFTPPWSQAESLPAGQYANGVASVADRIYVIGGPAASQTVSAYTPQTNNWQAIDTLPLEIGEGAKLVQVGEFLFIIGGRVNKIPSSKNLAYQAIYTVQIPLIIHK